ncbi:RNA polymerase factor sigma-54 [Fuscovulum ytuae]|uniref:RNA polymerase sigma-54 factor n=1 Tax=Fuscovulum ytuae TaxID=3042299 RepID=A0ABY8Q388_9RHOB|nr:RNA polymerase factor sigma-54 [Fuscovulum sp. YMD61]WGV14757.1 RNA polymerase factor sigma-54 [Fuscovulum sp. YMD61]
MSTGQRIGVLTRQRLSLTAGLHASIRVLKADAAGLARYLEEVAAENPALLLRPAAAGEWLPRWDGALRGGGFADTLDQVEGAGPSLMAHVAGWIARQRMGAEDQRIALALAEGLEPSGWLGVAVEAVAAELGVPSGRVALVLARVQRIEPAGLFARSLAECLLLQAEAEGDADPVLRAVIARLDLVAAGDVGRLARQLGAGEAEVMAAIRRLRGMNPKPGTQFDMQAAPVREPDLIARKGMEGWMVSLNRSSLPEISVKPGRGEGQGAARAVLRLVEARNDTLLRVGREILRRQEAALDHGASRLVPMTMAEVGAATDLHESTVSRVVAGTSVDTPKGPLWLRALFSGAMGGEGAPDISAAALRARLAEMVAAEDKTRPLSDEALVVALQAEGAVVARRTVSKYREMMGIAPARLRRVPGKRRR